LLSRGKIFKNGGRRSEEAREKGTKKGSGILRPLPGTSEKCRHGKYDGFYAGTEWTEALPPPDVEKLSPARKNRDSARHWTGHYSRSSFRTFGNPAFYRRTAIAARPSVFPDTRFFRRE